MPDKMDNSSQTGAKSPASPSTTTQPGLSGAGTPADATRTASMASPTTSSPGTGTTSAAVGSGGSSSIGTGTGASAAASSSSQGKSASQMAQETSDAARSRAGELADSARSEAAAMADKGKSMAYAKAEETKDRTSAEIENQAEHIRAAGREFGEDSYPAQAADYLASSLSDAADAIRRQDINSVIDEVTMFARRNPAVFLGGAALLGFVGARMLKASDRARHSPGRQIGLDDGSRRFDTPPAGVDRTPYAASTDTSLRTDRATAVDTSPRTGGIA